MTAPKRGASRSAVAEEPEDVVEAVDAAPVGKVVFVPSQHSSDVQTPSGATFSLSPQTSLKMTRTDAEDLAAAGFGTIQGD